MAGSVNKVILVGNLGADPDIRRTQDGRPIANLSLATSESWKDRNTGERRNKTEWHRVVIFNEGLCRIAEQYLHKGSKVYLEGQLQTRKWQDQNGQDRYSTEVVLQGFNASLTMLDNRLENEQGRHPNQPNNTQQSATQFGHQPINNQSQATTPGTPPQNNDGFGGPQSGFGVNPGYNNLQHAGFNQDQDSGDIPF